MNREFYIFRHGETDWNRQRRCQGHTDTLLNDTGIAQAKMLAQKLHSLPLEVIISSDLARAKQTGGMVAELKSIPMLVDSRLREMSYGEAEGMLFEDAVALFGEELWNQLGSFKKEFDHVGFPSGETRREARTRFLQALYHIIESTSHKIIGISTHGGALRNVLHSFLPEDHPLLPIPNCVVYHCQYIWLEKRFVVNPIPF